MNSVRDVLRLADGGELSRHGIATNLGVATGTVSNILRRAREAQVSWRSASQRSEVELHALLYPTRWARPEMPERLEPNWPGLLKEQKKKGYRSSRVTRHVLEAERRGLKAYGRSRFYQLLESWCRGKGKSAEIRFVYAPGDYMLSVFSGKTLMVTGREVARRSRSWCAFCRFPG